MNPDRDGGGALRGGLRSRWSRGTTSADAELAEHVGSCVTCFRLAELRDAPRLAATLRADAPPLPRSPIASGTIWRRAPPTRPAAWRWPARAPAGPASAAAPVCAAGRRCRRPRPGGRCVADRGHRVASAGAARGPRARSRAARSTTTKPPTRRSMSRISTGRRCGVCSTGCARVRPPSSPRSRRGRPQDEADACSTMTGSVQRRAGGARRPALLRIQRSLAGPSL